MHNRSIAASAAALLLAASLFSCGDTAETPEATTTAAPSETEIVT